MHIMSYCTTLYGNVQHLFVEANYFRCLFFWFRVTAFCVTGTGSQNRELVCVIKW